MASMLSFAVYAGDNLPLATAASGTNGSIQVSEHGVDTSNEIQQARVIQGTVLEEGTNEPLIGVNVVVKGTTIGTTTDVEGKYSIRIPSDNAVLVFSYIGQKTEEYSVKGLKSLDVIMKSDATMLSEVVVYTGYMTQKKADLTGSVALADSKDIKKTSANVMKAMQGKMAGVKISNNGGNPAEDIGIQIRGLSSLSGAVTPLIVLDGMPAEGLNLRDINSGDIESIQVLKDAASASIYGARASGGVILVQTKKGKAGKTTIDYNGSVSVSSIINRPEMMNATEWGTAAFRAAAYDEWAYGSGLLLPNGFEYEYHRGDNGMLVLDNMKMKEKGFTLVELLTVFAILSIILGMVVVNVNNYSSKQRQKDYENLVKIIEENAKVLVNKNEDLFVGVTNYASSKVIDVNGNTLNGCKFSYLSGKT